MQPPNLPWILVSWQGSNPKEVGRYATWSDADQVKGGDDTMSIEDVVTWEKLEAKSNAERLI